jgi:hypothetical protein
VSRILGAIQVPAERVPRASITQCVTNGYPSTTGNILRKCGCSPRSGCTTTIMTAQTWPWVGLRQSSDWPRPLDSTSGHHQFRGDYHRTARGTVCQLWRSDVCDCNRRSMRERQFSSWAGLFSSRDMLRLYEKLRGSHSAGSYRCLVRTLHLLR